MTEEAFALSPISARAARPSEEDYAAISEAFMETARGRWFLGEYAKRNRNADTSMVLDAVARLEESLAARLATAADHAGLAEARLAEAELAEAKLAEVLAAIRDAVDAAQAAAMAALDTLALEQKLAAVRKGARVLREIAWRLREIGNDGRICDLIDSQVGVIEAGAAQISSDEAQAALTVAFVAIEAQIAEFSDDETAPPVAEAPVASPAPARRHASPVVDLTATEVALVRDVPEAAASAAAAVVESADVADETAANAHDEAVLDLIAMEMGAPEPFEIDDTADMIVEEAHLGEAAPPEPEMVTAMAAEAPERAAAPVAPPVERAPQAIVESLPEPAIEISLGATILASGLVRKPSLAANDPLAPIRRMSQAEKIAFFS